MDDIAVTLITIFATILILFSFKTTEVNQLINTYENAKECLVNDTNENTIKIKENTNNVEMNTVSDYLNKSTVNNKTSEPTVITVVGIIIIGLSMVVVASIDTKDSGNKTCTKNESSSLYKNNVASELQDATLSVINEGQKYINTMKDNASRINNKAIQQSVCQIENSLNLIFDQIKEDSSQVDKLQKLLKYYLPTITKMTKNYLDFDSVNTPGNEILDAKIQIETSLNMMNDALKTLQNALFADDVIDTVTDAQVFQTMLASDGLLKDKLLNIERK